MNEFLKLEIPTKCYTRSTNVPIRRMRKRNVRREKARTKERKFLKNIVDFEIRPLNANEHNLR